MLMKTKDGWVRLTHSTHAIPAPDKVAVTYWWLGLCPVNPADKDK